MGNWRACAIPAAFSIVVPPPLKRSSIDSPVGINKKTYSLTILTALFKDRLAKIKNLLQAALT